MGLLHIYSLLQDAAVTELYNHPYYMHPSGINNDFAIFRFSPPVKYNKCVAPVCLPKQGYRFQAGIDMYTIGWGNLHSK